MMPQAIEIIAYLDVQIKGLEQGLRQLPDNINDMDYDTKEQYDITVGKLIQLEQVKKWIVEQYG